MGMFISSIKNIAGDCEKTHRWASINLTDDDANDSEPQKLSIRRIVKIGRSDVTVMGSDGATYKIEPARIQKVW